MSAAEPPARPSGIRKLTTGSLRANTLVEDYAKRAHYPTRSEASGAFKRAAPFIGHGPQTLALVDYLISLTQAQDWEGGPITVWPSNGRLCHIFGTVERTIQVQLTALNEAGLIAFLDSPSRRRYGVRDEDGRIRVAYGIDLRPLAARYEEFCATANAAEAEYQDRRALRRLSSIARQKTEQICDAAIALHPDDPAPWLQSAGRRRDASALLHSRHPTLNASQSFLPSSRTCTEPACGHSISSPAGQPMAETKTRIRGTPNPSFTHNFNKTSSSPRKTL